ncbi:non-specific lipid-transfer protein 13-like [Jatropha curcas]|uniref:non-specific lipid-transfer protein 13-like n=1 Tax=Jatropha curcas TaxID=180498 RepID=UPI0005FB01C4|nr:non-specific lipid-transfer protein 13-like [Jatropha curcas]
MARIAAFLTFILLLSTSAMSHRQRDSIDCLNVVAYFSSCVEFLNGHVHEPTWNCCMGIQELNRLAKQNHSAQRICQCIELIGKTEDPPFLLASIHALPIKCHTHLSFPISIKKDCSRIP